ncbi:MAG: HAMP domain-containing histidine kinase, partial [Candidatus Latescibacterota bacterium]
MRRFGRYYRSAIEQLRDPLLVVDTKGRIQKSNRSARAVLDLGDSGRLIDVVSLEKSFVFDGQLMMSLVDRPTSVIGHQLTDAEGNRADVTVDVIDLDGKGDKSRIKLIHIKDFSSYKKYERWKDELISMVAHEIRNPLSAMKNSMNILLSQATGEITDEQHKLLTVSTRSIDRLTRLLDNVLDISRVSMGSYIPRPEWVDAREFVSEVVDTFKTLFNIRRKHLDTFVSEEIDRIYIDPSKIEQILINLLNNAVKFTSDGEEVLVSVEPSSLEALDDDLRIVPWNDFSRVQFVRFVVRDTGFGMTENTLSHLFTRHYGGREDGSAGGAHLGLSISKTLVEVQNGRIEFESELGVGTEVTVSVPADKTTFDMVNRVSSLGRVLNRLSTMRAAVMFYVL